MTENGSISGLSIHLNCKPMFSAESKISEARCRINLLHRWRRELRQGRGNAFPGEGKRRREETRAAELERKVGRQSMEIDFLKGCLRRIEQQRKLQASAGKPLSATRSGNKSRRHRR